MKRLIALILASCLVFSGCSFSKNEKAADTNDNSKIVSETNKKEESHEKEVKFDNLSSAGLTEYMEDAIYEETIKCLPPDEFFVEDVQAVYVSQEYLQELSYNSRDNVFFGYTLSDVEREIGDDKYVFTCNDKGETVVCRYEDYDDTYEKIIKDVATGTGVILVCATISAVTVGAPAVSVIFAVSAKTGTVVALSSAGIGAAISAAVTGYQTKDVKETLKAAALAGADGFKWGAIAGALTGGFSEANLLRGATLNGLTMNEAALIQKESGYAVDIIKQFHSMDEYKVYKEAGLTTKTINGNKSLVRKIDLDYKSEMPDGKVLTNLERMQEGYAPLEPSTGASYQLHHLGQRNDGSLAILTQKEHQGYSSILHTKGGKTEIVRKEFDAFRSDYWKEYAKSVVSE